MGRTETIRLKRRSMWLGGRYRADGAHSAQEIREDLLVPAVWSDATKIVVDFTATYGAGFAFIEELFGGLVRYHELDAHELNARLVFEGLPDDLVMHAARCMMDAQRALLASRASP